MKPEPTQRTVLRLRTAAGHLRAVASLLEHEAEPGMILAQLAAVQKALEAARRVIIGNLLSECADSIRREPSADVRAAELGRMMEGIKHSLGRRKWKGELFK